MARMPASIPMTAPDTPDERDATTPPPATMARQDVRPPMAAAKRSFVSPASMVASSARRRMAPRR